MGLKFNVNAQEIAAMFNEMKQEVEADLLEGVAALAAMTTAKIDEMAAENLHSSLHIFKENFVTEEVAPGVHVLTIKEGALWIEEGISPGKDMKPALLKNASVNPRTGIKSKVIPFEHSKAPTQMTPYAQSLVSQIRSELRARRIPFKTIERDKKGAPRLGKLHSFNMPSSKPTRRATSPALQGISIYQQQNAKTGRVRRDIMTFRTVSNGPASEGKWIHPGYQAQKFLDRAMEWAANEWENNILPQILAKWQG